ncbi:5-(carboxyamino)imidazole ribonucleotide synthase [Cyclobacterium jeungdonense]|uniref:N5-carboxyaminoimidazole ribonucleotide synthase n=1 Tax=Cyclobacterium jeungdonense TaxID=708087 RepID=A0ABT8C9W2_9BACT|nr:5-(carboxyamino)imidazole ribonucleotide synthase [Cyclobacterium jeungdonense]MDN3689590.1 5-(carboxyamino)imidazole ribonucleotide synthase [Cyclobacterium jeungdonense]
MQRNYQQQTLGILGGGQLGRMLIQSAINYNLDIHILDPDAEAPCKNLCSRFVQGSLTDFNTVYEFGKECEVISIEIEHVNTEALYQLEKEGKKIFPQPHIIELIQDKRKQKQFYLDRDIPTAPFVLTETKADVKQHLDFLPAVHKLGKEGYDGRGVQLIRSASDLDKAFDAPGLLEKFVDFDKELAVIVARNEQGEVKTFPSVECAFHPVHNLVEFLFSPATISPETDQKAQSLALEVIEKLDMVGLLAVELFVTKAGEILVNEIAPRPHNSGHHTIEANYTSQFEQHLRAVMGMPLGDTGIRSAAAMVNLLGEAGYTGEALVEGMDEALKEKGVYLHLYGKKLTKPFRKMGHVTVLEEDVDRLREKAQRIKELIKIKA